MLTRFSFDLPGDLVFDPGFELDIEIIKTNISSKIHGDYFKNITFRVLTRFSSDLALEC